MVNKRTAACMARQRRYGRVRTLAVAWLVAIHEKELKELMVIAKKEIDEREGVSE